MALHPLEVVGIMVAENELKRYTLVTGHEPFKLYPVLVKGAVKQITKKEHLVGLLLKKDVLYSHIVVIYGFVRNPYPLLSKVRYFSQMDISNEQTRMLWQEYRTGRQEL